MCVGGGGGVVGGDVPKPTNKKVERKETHAVASERCPI